MGINYTIYCEAKTENSWINIDFWQRAPNGTYGIIPVMRGRSVLGGALNWHKLLDHRLQWKDLSDSLRNFYPINTDDQTWYAFDYTRINNLDFEKPQYSGYVQKSDYYETETDLRIDLLSECFENGEALSALEFAALTPEAQQGFIYCEHTDPYGMHEIMKMIIRNVNSRIFAYKNEFPNTSPYYQCVPDITQDIRIVVRLD